MKKAQQLNRKNTTVAIALMCLVPCALCLVLFMVLLQVNSIGVQIVICATQFYNIYFYQRVIKSASVLNNFYLNSWHTVFRRKAIQMNYICIATQVHYQ
jgi:hypothetical protein